MTIVSPIRYQGCKRTLIPTILEHMPDQKDCDRLIDAFGGSATVVLNMPHTRRVYNELNPHVYEIVRLLASEDPKRTLSRIKRVVKRWSLTNSNEWAYDNFRDHVQKKQDPLLNYIAHRHAHSNLLRFNQSGEYNVPFGDRGLIGKFDDLEQELVQFHSAMQGVHVVNYTYTDLLNKLRKQLNSSTIVYFDPPYLASGAAAYGSKWTEIDEIKLLHVLEWLTQQGVLWMLSNVVQHRHFENKMLKKWLKKNAVNVYYPSKTYAMANAQDDSHSTVEILATNY